MNTFLLTNWWWIIPLAAIPLALVLAWLIGRSDDKIAADDFSELLLEESRVRLQQRIIDHVHRLKVRLPRNVYLIGASRPQ